MDRRSVLKLPLGGAALAAFGFSRADAALVPPFFMYCVVAIGGIVSEVRDGRPINSKWTAIGTGFFYGHLVQPDPDLAKRQYAVYLVTAKHVVDGWKTQQGVAAQRGMSVSDMIIRVNPIALTSPATDFSISEIKDNKDTGWTNNPNGKDIAVLSVNIDTLRQKAFGIAFFPDDEMVANVAKLNDLKVSAGDGTFVLGFPMGLVGEWRNGVIVREGIIARVEDMLISKSDSFLINSFVFPETAVGQ